MARKIKFRAWDEGNKVMHYDFEFIRSGDDSGEGSDWIIFKSDKQRLEDSKVFDNPYFNLQLKIMQYTGLNDKNGIEIYENDIVDTIIKSGIRQKNKIHFEYGAFRVGLQPLNVQEDIEVIGNTYENKEIDWI